MNITTLLETEIEDEAAKLASLDPGTKEHQIAVESLTKLTDRLIDIRKFDDEMEFKKSVQESEENLKIASAKEEKKDRLIKNCIAVAGIVLPLALTVWGTKTSLKFEEEGTITTSIGRGFINKLLPKK